MLDAATLRADASDMVSALADRYIVVNAAARLPALFVRDYVNVLGVETGRPAVIIAAEDYPGIPAQGDVVDDSYDGTRYAVREVQPDAYGLYVLLLEKTS